jgi:hypothetical protein
MELMLTIVVAFNKKLKYDNLLSKSCVLVFSSCVQNEYFKHA